MFNCFVVINLSMRISSLNSGADRIDCYRMNVKTCIIIILSSVRQIDVVRTVCDSFHTLCSFANLLKLISEEGCTRKKYFGRIQPIFLISEKNVSCFYSLYPGL